jgi:hypothetical protein
MWAVTWVIISMPLIITWHHWYITRMRWFSAIPSVVEDKSKAEIQIKVLQEIQPIPLWNIIATALLSAGGFILPLFK